MEIVTMSLTQLNPAAYNPRKKLAPGDTEYEQIKKSITKFGMVEPIIWNKRTGNVVGGHQRLTVLLDLGYETSEISVIDIDETEEKSLNIALNKITGEWDDEKLTALLEELAIQDEYMLELTGFTDIEIDELFSVTEVALFGNDTPENEPEDDHFDVESALEESAYSPIAKPGDIYVLGGKHRLMCGDSTSADDVAKLMGGRKAKLTVTDPPYNVAYEGTAGTMQNDSQSDTDFHDFLLSAFKNIHNNITNGAAVYIFHADSEGLNFRKAFESAGFKARQCLIWVKNSLVLGRQDYHWRHEPILYGWKDGKGHYFIDDRTQSTVLEQNRPTVNRDHPTMKPVPLIERLIYNSSKKTWIVLDLFGGSGSTLMAADRLERVAYLMELDPKYCDVIVRRYLGSKSDNSGEVVLIRDGIHTVYSEVADYE